jgi:hypothetical protein
MLDDKKSSILSKFILIYYHEIKLDFNGLKKSFYLDLLKFGNDFKNTDKIDECLKESVNPPSLISCIKS